MRSCLAVGIFDGAAAVMSGPLASPSWAVSASWDPGEDARLQAIAGYLGETPEDAQKSAVYLLAFLIGVAQLGPDPQVLPPAGGAATYTSIWSPSEYAVLDAVEAHFAVDDADATRASVGVLGYLLSLDGH